MVRLLTLAVVGGLAAVLTTSSAVADDAQASAPAAAATKAPAAKAAPAPTTTTAPAVVVAPRRTYRSYSYNPTTSGRYYRGVRNRAYAYGVRDAASKSLGVNQPFSR